jgi:hypothetical protein
VLDIGSVLALLGLEETEHESDEMLYILYLYSQSATPPMSFPKFGRIAEMRPENFMLMRVKPRYRGKRIWLELACGRLTV